MRTALKSLLAVFMSLAVIASPFLVASSNAQELPGVLEPNDPSSTEARLQQLSDSERRVVERFDAERKDAIQDFEVDMKILNIEHDKSKEAATLDMVDAMSVQEEAYIERINGLDRLPEMENQKLLEMIEAKSEYAQSSTASQFKQVVGAYQEKSKEIISDYESTATGRHSDYQKYSETQIKDGMDQLQDLATKAITANVSPTSLSVPASGTAAAVIAEAQQHLGKPYDYGNYNIPVPRAFDCSSFVQYVYKQVGVSLPRVTYDQVNCGVAVAAEDLMPGDLVFFYGDKPRQKNGHVGIYIGNDTFIEAPHSGATVQMSTLSSRTLTAARRVL